jgi:hypothetical protein
VVASIRWRRGSPHQATNGRSSQDTIRSIYPSSPSLSQTNSISIISTTPHTTHIDSIAQVRGQDARRAPPHGPGGRSGRCETLVLSQVRR